MMMKRTFMAETTQEEHERLQRRTEELRREHTALERAPFDYQAHAKHQERLRQHHADLIAHRQRLDDRV